MYNFSFFLNQQFITWHVVVDCGSDYVATYMHSKLTLRYKGEGEEKESEREKQKIVSKNYSKANAFGLSVKNKMKWLNESLLGFQYPLNLQQSCSICLLVLIG